MGWYLLDEIVFERQRFALVVHDDVVEVGDFAHQGAGFGVGPTGFQEVRAHAGAQRARLADVENGAERVLEQIDAGLGGQVRDFFREFHGRGTIVARGTMRGLPAAAGNIHDSKANLTRQH